MILTSLVILVRTELNVNVNEHYHTVKVTDFTEYILAVTLRSIIVKYTAHTINTTSRSVSQLVNLLLCIST